MIRFPHWVAHPSTQPKSDLAVKRLRFLVLNAAIQKTMTGNISSFSAFCDLDRTQVHAYLRAGRFSPNMAEAIEDAIGDRDLIRKEWLVFPLRIEQI